MLTYGLRITRSPAGLGASSGSSANCKLGLTNVGLSLLSTSETFNNWTDGRTYHCALICFACYYTADMISWLRVCCQSFSSVDILRAVNGPTSHNETIMRRDLGKMSSILIMKLLTGFCSIAAEFLGQILRSCIAFVLIELRQIICNVFVLYKCVNFHSTSKCLQSNTRSEAPHVCISLYAIVKLQSEVSSKRSQGVYSSSCNPSLSYGVSPVIWDHTVLPDTRHRWTWPNLTPSWQAILDLPSAQG